jgi:predicted oxidoreductase
MSEELKLSPVIAGCMKWGAWGAGFSTQQYLQLIENCLENNISSFDHADIYGNYTVEEEFGKALKLQPDLRKRMQIITKCGIRMLTPNRPEHKIKSYDTSKNHIIQSTERSLKKFHTDYLDALLIHRPDPLMHPDEIAEAFTQLKKQGKVLHFGVSNFTASQLDIMIPGFQIEFNQIEISVINPEPFHNGQLDQCIRHKIRPMAWSPIGGGQLLSNKADAKYHQILTVVQFLSEKYDATPDQILLAFLFRHPSGIIPVMGTTKIERLIVAYKAAALKIEREEWFLLWQASTGHDVP